MVEFLYTGNLNNDECCVTIGGYSYIGSHMEFVCHVLNKNWYAITEGTLGNVFYDEISKVNFSLNKEYKSNNEKSLVFNLLKNHFSKIDLKKLKLFVDEVLLEDNFRKLTAGERAWVYKCLYNGCENYFEFEKIELQGSIKFTAKDFNNVIRGLVYKSEKNKDFQQKRKNLDNLAKQKKFEVNQTLEYNFKNFEDLLRWIISRLIKNNITIKKCDCCQKYFYPPHRVDTLYCNNYAPDKTSLEKYLEELEKFGRVIPNIEKPPTCPKYMRDQKRVEREQNDECLKIYRQIYNSMNNKLRRYRLSDGSHKTLKEDIELFKKQASQWKHFIKDGKKSESEYLEWLKKYKSEKVALPNGINNWKLENGSK